MNTAFAGFSQITLEATHDLTLAQNTAWNLSQSTGQSSGTLTLEAGKNLIFQDGSSIFDANNWSVNLKAGVNNFSTGALTPGVGSIYLNGGNGLANGGSIQTTTGSINLAAGMDIQTGNGSLTDVNGNPFSSPRPAAIFLSTREITSRSAAPRSKPPPAGNIYPRRRKT